MAILGGKKKEEKKDSKTDIAVEAKETTATKEKQPFTVSKKKGRCQTARMNHATDLSKVLIRPRITEKASDATIAKTYVFEIAVDATKRDVVKAVEE